MQRCFFVPAGPWSCSALGQVSTRSNVTKPQPASSSGYDGMGRRPGRDSLGSDLLLSLPKRRFLIQPDDARS
jgi:hypothetical protein